MYITVGETKHDWNTGLCDCCEDMEICCCAFWFMSCFMCKTVKEFGECLCLPLLDLEGAGAISLAFRSAVRERYRIKGSICDDCCKVTCCSSCSWCQVAREIKHQKRPITIINANVHMAPAPAFFDATVPPSSGFTTYPTAPPSNLYPPIPAK
ncbi:cornifelin homolog [Protopterus annectens]|uniref:cornifelin homolog n=1 Tax=Protopterus annectens TaxID=7888 RepID=UPI001CFA5ABD|nr:cornifelin homolog [Protopterus annectens]